MGGALRADGGERRGGGAKEFGCAAGVGCSEGAGKQRGAMRWGERFALTGVCGEVGGVNGVGCAAGDGEWDEEKRKCFALTGSTRRAWVAVRGMRRE